jgi:exodeoxyribonuclease VII large subunit
LFDQSKKLSIPQAPKHIGVITSSSTAAFQDIVSTIQRRAPFAQVSISPAVVQGDAAPNTIINSLNRIIKFNDHNQDNPIDLVLICRGGGSIEDLWCFNNENLAREIASFPIPTISGVGHEIDFTICDFVADMRAPTPTASAEIATEFNFQAKDKIINFYINLQRTITNSILNKIQKIEYLKKNIRSPLMILREQNQKIDSYEMQLKQNIKMLIAENKQALSLLRSRFKERSPNKYIQQLNLKIDNIKNLIKKEIKSSINRNTFLIQEYEKNLEILNPLSILERGYSIIQNKSGESIKSNQDVNVGETLTARLNKGFIDVEVKNKKDDI